MDDKEAGKDIVSVCSLDAGLITGIDIVTKSFSFDFFSPAQTERTQNNSKKTDTHFFIK